MASWHKPARFAVAVFGLAMAGLVYSQLGERQAVASRPPVERTDEKAIFEAKNCNLARTLPASVQRIVDIQGCDLIQGYADGSLRLVGLKRIVVRRGDKEFVATGDEARIGPESKDIEIIGGVTLRASDGFELHTDRATFNEDDGIATAPNAVTFSRGGMSGSGAGISWDQNAEILLIGEAAHIVLKDAEGNTTTELAATSAMLDRLQDLLLLNDGAHVLRGSQVIDARDATAQLLPDESAITFVKLTGDARVTGAGGIDAMSARDIDLHYTEDGTALEGVVMRGGSAIAMTGQNGSPGRQILGESLDIGLATDGSLLRVVGNGKVQLTLPAAAGTPGRTIQSAVLDANGQPGKGLTDAVFTGEVTFTEEATKGAARRTARADRLELALADDAVNSATFTGRASFEEPGLVAAAPRVDYQPHKAVLRLTAADRGPAPCVANGTVAIEGQSIDVTLEGQRFAAAGGVRTTMRQEGRGGATCGGRAVSAPAPKADAATTKLPGLLDQSGAAVVTALTLDYQGAAGKVVYTGSGTARATLVQGTTTVRGETLTIDQASGDFTASGSAVTAITLDGQPAQGDAREIRYVDATRTMTLLVPAGPRGAQPPAAGAPGTIARLYGPQGDMRAGRIEVLLAKDGRAVERIEATRDVSILLAARSVTSADRLTYHAAEKKYDVFATALRPLVWLERDGKDCRENTGTTLTFGQDGSGATLDGRQRRMQTAPKPCPATFR